MTTTRRSGLQRFTAADAMPLADSGMMSIPTTDPPAVEEMVEWGTSAGHVVKVLFGDPEAGGMSLVWSWFAPGYALPRHSHSADCLYYVTSGELRLGNQVVPAGDGFFVPDGAPYAYTAGPEGVEIVEFRSTSTFDMQISESVPRWAQILEVVRTNREGWAAAAPAHR
jgi:quercetin dioxygenase-like cupin family protein